MVTNFNDKLEKNYFKLEMLKLLENIVKTQVWEHFFFQIFNSGKICEHFDQKGQKKGDFLPNNNFFLHFPVKMFKNIA